MMKKISLYILIVASLFLFNNRVFADNTCRCDYSSSNSKFTGEFSVDISSGSIINKKIVLKGDIENSKDKSSHNIDKTEKIKNWEKKYNNSLLGITNFDFVGKDFFNENKKCPSHLYVLDLIGGYELFVSNGTNDIIENKLTDFQGYEILTSNQNETCSVQDVSNDEPLVDSASSCYDYPKETCEVEEKLETSSGEMNKKFSCIWVEGKNTPGYCNVDKLQYVKCGDSFDIPEQAPRIMSFAINLLKIGTPIILIITGIITLIKAVAASKEDEIKKAISLLIKKAIASTLVFLVIMIVQFVMSKAADSSDIDSMSKCLSCFLNNECSSSVYFKTKVGDSYVCHLVSDPSKTIDCGENSSTSNSSNNTNDRSTNPNSSNRRISGQTQ